MKLLKHFFRADTGFCKCGLNEAEASKNPDQDCPARKKIQEEWRAKQEARKWKPERAINIFSYRPRPGDIWEVKIPGKKPFVKTIKSLTYDCKKDFRIPAISWDREPKARYFGHPARLILQYGELLYRDPERLCNICCSDLDRKNFCRNIHCEGNQ